MRRLTVAVHLQTAAPAAMAAPMALAAPVALAELAALAVSAARALSAVHLQMAVPAFCFRVAATRSGTTARLPAVMQAGRLIMPVPVLRCSRAAQ